MRSADDLAAAAAALRSIAPRFHSSTDDELIADVQQIEALGRMVDGLRLQAAAQVEHRSRAVLGERSLAFRNGARDGVQLVEHLTGVSHRTAAARVGLGSALAPEVSLLGDLLPGRYQVLADALTAGEVGAEAARFIVGTVQAMRRRVDREGLDLAVEMLTHAAAGLGLDQLRETADHIVGHLDPDGLEPTHRNRRRKRSLKLGRTLHDGTTLLSMVLLPEHLAVLRELLQSRRRSRSLIRTAPGGDDTVEETDPEYREEEAPDGGEARPRVQQDYDTVFESLVAGIRAEADGTQSHAVTHEIVVTITADELEARNGQAFAAGVLAGIPLPEVERQSCTAGIRLLVTGADGEALYLSRAHRVFSSAQKKALTVAAGGRCQYPGCTTPSPFLEAHHAKWFHRDHGDTHVDNGVMLCSYHHHLIHADQSPVVIRRHDGDMWFVARGHRGPYREHHRRQRGPARDAALARARRTHDPARSPFRS